MGDNPERIIKWRVESSDQTVSRYSNQVSDYLKVWKGSQTLKSSHPVKIATTNYMAIEKDPSLDNCRKS